MIHSTLKQLIGTGILFLTGLMVSPQLAMAQMLVNPIVIETETQKGQAKGSFAITNMGDSPMRARVGAEPFTYGKQGFEALTSSPTDLTPYLNFSPREFVLQPGQTRQVRLSTQLLPSLNNREFRAIIFAENLMAENDGKAGTQSAVVPRIGVTFYVRHGKVEPQLSVVESSIADDQKVIKLLVKNSGNATVRPAVRWKILNQGQSIATGQFENITIIADGEREIPLPIALEKPLSAGSYQFAGELVWMQGKQQQAQPFTSSFVVK